MPRVSSAGQTVLSPNPSLRSNSSSRSWSSSCARPSRKPPRTPPPLPEHPSRAWRTPHRRNPSRPRRPRRRRTPPPRLLLPPTGRSNPNQPPLFPSRLQAVIPLARNSQSRIRRPPPEKQRNNPAVTRQAQTLAQSLRSVFSRRTTPETETKELVTCCQGTGAGADHGHRGRKIAGRTGRAAKAARGAGQEPPNRSASRRRGRRSWQPSRRRSRKWKTQQRADPPGANADRIAEDRVWPPTAAEQQAAGLLARRDELERELVQSRGRRSNCGRNWRSGKRGWRRRQEPAERSGSLAARAKEWAPRKRW